MIQEKIIVADSSLFPQMETKWFKVEFSPDEPNVHHKIYAFASYVEDRSVLNSDLHFIEYFVQNDFGKISYERLLKTNSRTYLNELKMVYNLKEVKRPENIIERTETLQLKETLKSILANNSLAKVVPERNPEFGEFVSEVLEFNDIQVVFKNSPHATKFPYNRNLFSLVYRNIFDIKEITKSN